MINEQNYREILGFLATQRKIADLQVENLRDKLRQLEAKAEKAEEAFQNAIEELDEKFSIHVDIEEYNKEDNFRALTIERIKK